MPAIEPAGTAQPLPFIRFMVLVHSATVLCGHNLIPPVDSHLSLSNYNGPILNFAEKIARIQGLKVHASFEKPITHEKIVAMLDLVKANTVNPMTKPSLFKRFML